jgi:hypothetical protein
LGQEEEKPVRIDAIAHSMLMAAMLESEFGNLSAPGAVKRLIGASPN